MKDLIAVALSMLLLVSAAAAQGNNNIATVTVNENTTDMSITGANIAQLSDLDANLLGNDNLAGQIVESLMLDSDLTGLGNGKTNAIQMADFDLSNTGNANRESQVAVFVQGENDLAIGNITQMTVEKLDNIGNNNGVFQGVDAFAGVFSGEGSPNLLTNSDLAQTSVFDACVEGNANFVGQLTEQFATDNNLVNSKLYEQADTNANILGNDNNLNGLQTAVQIADANLLTNSWANELICLDEKITGNSNDVSQNAETNTTANLLTASTELQSINAAAKELGSGNLINQNIDLENNGNIAVSGHILQEADIESNV